ncbi:MAG: SMC-Scp complex subunit ScpB [Patescibacteria group bacterium]
MNDLAAKIESILFLSTRPVSFTKLAKMLEVKEGEIKIAIEELQAQRNVSGSGIHIVVADAAVELGTNPGFADILDKMSKEETEAELTRPQLETLTIIAYRGPITKPEIEQIRGVNCSIILRNLAVRGFVVEREDKKFFQSVYTLSSEMLRHLGVHEAKELPDYNKFHDDKKIDSLLEAVFNTPVDL